MPARASPTLTGDATWEVVTSDISVDLQGNGDVDIANFVVRRLDTSIQGVVLNDRDGDNINDSLSGEPLAGVILELYSDTAATGALDNLVGTATTNSLGGYTFSDLREGRYIVKALQPGTAVVSRGVTAAGGHVDTTVAITAATTVGEGNNNTRTVGSSSPSLLPRWDYAMSTVFFDGRTNFTFLFSNTSVQGTIETAAGVAVANKEVALQRCLVSAGAMSPAVGGTCTSNYPSWVVLTTTTDANGAFSFANLQEGVYQVTPLQTTGVTAPVSALYQLEGNGDIEDLLTPFIG